MVSKILIQLIYICSLLSELPVGCDATIPVPENFFEFQFVDHVDPLSPYDGRVWKQRYYVYDKHFQGPGYPIFVILGGEGNIEPETGIVYPFVADRLAERFGAFVLQPEHRFYGASQPISRSEIHEAREKGRDDPRVTLLTSEQALHDAVRLIKSVRVGLGCSALRYSEHYCPIITVGGSYPGFLAALSKLIFPHVVDIAYAASAPMKFYAQQVDSNAYYDHITAVAEKASSGCAAAVKESLEDVVKNIRASSPTAHETDLGICQGTTPVYIKTSETFVEEIVMMVGYTFANYNMAFYPPSKETRLFQACATFQSSGTSVDKVKKFMVNEFARGGDDCFNMTEQLPTGPRATISGGDWSGVGTGTSAESWDFQTCTLCVEAISFGVNSMFPFRPWTLGWLDQHCHDRFGVAPRPLALADEWHIDDILKTRAKHILFTNGLNDGWSVSGIQSNLSDTLVALNFPNGAHHSDLNHRAPNADDTDDIKQGFDRIEGIFSTWLHELGMEWRQSMDTVK